MPVTFYTEEEVSEILEIKDDYKTHFPRSGWHGIREFADDMLPRMKKYPVFFKTETKIIRQGLKHYRKSAAPSA